MKIELDLYSGRPNPSWELSDEELAALWGRLAALPAAQPSEPRDGLGYRGLRAVWSAASSASDRARPPFALLELGFGRVKCQGHTGALAYSRDTERAFERWLLTSAQGKVDEAVRQVALDTLDC